MTTDDHIQMTLSLWGRFALADQTGTSRAPKSAKAQALIAMIATSETGGRGRLWLQKKLWSQSDRDRASVSLRQALSEVRRAFGPARHVLRADRRSVSLDMSKMTLVARQGDQEFLEGIGLGDRDPVLGKWLDRERNGAGASAPVASLVAPVSRPKPRAEGPAKVVFYTTAENARTELIEDIFVDCVVRSLRDAMTVDIHLATEKPVKGNTFRVAVQAYAIEGAKIGIRARIAHGTDESLIWAGMTSTQLHGARPMEDLEVASLGDQLIAALTDALAVNVDQARDLREENLLVRMGVERIVETRSEDLTQADVTTRRVATR